MEYQLRDVLEFLNVLFIPMLIYIVMLERRMSELKTMLTILSARCPIFHESGLGECRLIDHN